MWMTGEPLTGYKSYRDRGGYELDFSSAYAEEFNSEGRILEDILYKYISGGALFESKHFTGLFFQGRVATIKGSTTEAANTIIEKILQEPEFECIKDLVYPYLIKEQVA